MQQLKLDAESQDFARAFRSVKGAKNLYLWLLILSILTQVGAAAAVRFGKVLDPIYGKPAAASMPAATATTSPAAPSRELKLAQQVDSVMYWALPISKFVAMAACLLYMLTLLLAVKISLLDRLGGAGGLVSALLWSFILLALLIPWQQIMTTSIARGALFNTTELLNDTAKQLASWGAASLPDQLHQILYYARYFGYPAIALIVCIITQVKFACGYKNIVVFRPNRGEGNGMANRPQSPA